MNRILCFALALAVAAPAIPCSRVGAVVPEELVVHADLIVRAVALAYERAPTEEGVEEWVVRPDGDDSIASSVTFGSIEVLKGEVPQQFSLPGLFVAEDDFNDHPPPYTFVRPAGRRGNCWAYHYKAGGEYLFLLKRRGDGYSVNWYALGPVNEQLTGANDPWLLWVKGFLAAGRYLTSVKQP